ncbi:DinB family protein [Dehalococcoidia bacterium]|nr:DinB family protein [Dehalococcoidia bacterium]
MSVKEFIRDSLALTRKDLLENVRDLDPEELQSRVVPHVNPIAFLLWHLARVEDGWIQRPVQRRDHLWLTNGWHRKFEMPEDQRDIGHNYSVEQIDAFKTPSLDLLLGYLEEARGATLAFLDLWDPDTDQREVRTIWGSIIGVADVFKILLWEINQHAGQIAYIRGLLRGLQRPNYMGPMSTA